MDGAIWVLRRVGAGMLFLCGLSLAVWAVFELSDSILDALVAIGVGVSFLVGHALVGAFED